MIHITYIFIKKVVPVYYELLLSRTKIIVFIKTLYCLAY